MAGEPVFAACGWCGPRPSHARPRRYFYSANQIWCGLWCSPRTSAELRPHVYPLHLLIYRVANEISRLFYQYSEKAPTVFQHACKLLQILWTLPRNFVYTLLLISIQRCARIKRRKPSKKNWVKWTSSRNEGSKEAAETDKIFCHVIKSSRVYYSFRARCALITLNIYHYEG